jgi:hypothetical protein
VARGLIDHEHKHEPGALEVEPSYWRDGMEWLCTKCGAEGFVEGVAIAARESGGQRHA